jgi:hypothetical protein
MSRYFDCDSLPDPVYGGRSVSFRSSVLHLILLSLTLGFAGYNLKLVILNGQWFGSANAGWYYFTSAAEWRFRLA